MHPHSGDDQPGHGDDDRHDDEQSADERLLVEPVGIAQPDRGIAVQRADDGGHREHVAEEEALHDEPGAGPRSAQRRAGGDQRRRLDRLDRGVDLRQVEQARNHRHGEHAGGERETGDAEPVPARTGARGEGLGQQRTGEHQRGELHEHVGRHARLEQRAQRPRKAGEGERRAGERAQPAAPDTGIARGKERERASHRDGAPASERAKCSASSSSS